MHACKFQYIQHAPDHLRKILHIFLKEILKLALLYTFPLDKWAKNERQFGCIKKARYFGYFIISQYTE